ncbi:MAG: helix-turn-helix transcriptional regulator [Anaerolineae bacterium]|nr:helix-turn-helix transcriptional regulator [Anaerolineae bacterium]
MSNLSVWLAEETKERGWSYRELARRAGISQSLISKILSGDTKPSINFCNKIAHALGESPEKVLRLAEILPSSQASNDDSILAELQDIVKNLPPGQRKEALRYLRFLYQNKHEEDN